jgi:hypothetical protein
MAVLGAKADPLVIQVVSEVEVMVDSAAAAAAVIREEQWATTRVPAVTRPAEAEADPIIQVKTRTIRRGRTRVTVA